MVDITAEGAADHTDKLARKYTGATRYSHRPGEVRLILKIRPDRLGGGVTRG